MKIQELIDILLKLKDREIGDIEFWNGSQELYIKNIKGFELTADVIVTLKRLKKCKSSDLLGFKVGNLRPECQSKFLAIQDLIKKESLERIKYVSE